MAVCLLDTLPGGGSRPLAPEGRNPVLAHSIICCVCTSTLFDMSGSSADTHTGNGLPARIPAVWTGIHKNNMRKHTHTHTITHTKEKYHDLPVKLHRWLFCTWAVCCRWADEKTCKMCSRATAFPHTPDRGEDAHCNVSYQHSWRILIGRQTHHWEFAISKPHDPAGAFSGPTATCHPPWHNPAGPPGESPQLPPDQLSDPEPTAVLKHTASPKPHTLQVTWQKNLILEKKGYFAESNVL